MDELLIRTFQAYRRGLLQKIGPEAPQLPPRDFEALKYFGTLGWTAPRDRVRLRRIAASCARGLAAARARRLAEAVEHYERAGEELELLRASSRLGWLLGASLYEPGVAYLEFRRGQEKAARAHLDETLEICHELELAGLPLMQLHRIQQGHNLVRMSFRLDRGRNAIELTGLLVAYLESRIDALPFHRNWRPRSLPAIARPLLRDMAQQILGETVVQLFQTAAPAQDWLLLVRSADPLPDPGKALLPWGQFLLRAQAGLYAGDTASYLRNLEAFFAAGIGSRHHLWYQLLAGLFEFCLAGATRLSGQIAATLSRDSAKWKGLPPSLRDRFHAAALLPAAS